MSNHDDSSSRNSVKRAIQITTVMLDAPLVCAGAYRDGRVPSVMTPLRATSLSCLTMASGRSVRLYHLLPSKLATCPRGRVRHRLLDGTPIGVSSLAAIKNPNAASYPFCSGEVRRRTPGPPPFSSINSRSWAMALIAAVSQVRAASQLPGHS